MFLWGRSNPKASALQQLLERTLKIGERRDECRRTNNNNQIPSRHNVRPDQPKCLARTTLGPVAVMRFAQVFRDHKPCACPTSPIAGCIQNEQRMRPRFAFATHPRKLLWPTQPFLARQRHELPMPALYRTALVTDRKLPAAFVAAGFQDRTSIFGRHARQKAMFPAAWNPLRVPGKAHCFVSPQARFGSAAEQTLHTKSAELAPRPSTRELPSSAYYTALP